MKIEVFYFICEDGSVNVSLYPNLRGAVGAFLSAVRGYGFHVNTPIAQRFFDEGEYEKALELLHAIDGDFFDMDTLKVDSQFIEVHNPSMIIHVEGGNMGS